MENLQPKLRFPEFEKDWETKKLQDFCTFFSGGTPTSTNKKYYNGNIPFIKSGEISSDRTEQFITEDGLKNSSAKLVNEGDILYALYGATSGQVSVSKLNGAINQAVLCIRPNNSNNNLLKEILSFNKQNIIDKYIQGGQGNLSGAIVKNLSFNFPTLQEQTKIADFLGAVDKQLDILNQKKEKLNLYKKGVMQQLFSQQLRFKNDNGNDFPDWEEKTLGEVCTIIMGQSPDSNSYNSEGLGLPLIQGNADIINRKSNPRQHTSQITKISEIGDILFTVRAPVGAVGINYLESCIGRGVAAIRANQSQQYMYQFLLFIENDWDKLSQGSTFTAINSKDLKNYKLFIPSIAEQTKIANFLSAIDTQIQAVENQITKTETYKKGLLQQMFV
ncbi:restriction endonuclease subunit S [Empedobacter falsenii]